MSIFERFAKAFPLVSDEGKRWDKEGPLITELARESGEGNGGKSPWLALKLWESIW